MRIGLSQRIIHYAGRDHDATDHGWYEILRGHNLFFLPNTLNQDFDAIANDLDSFIITAGNDDELRNSVEMTLATKMLERDKIVFGVERGSFVIAKLLGYELVDLPNHMDLDHYIFYHRELLEVNSHHTLGIKTANPNTEILCNDYFGHIESFKEGNLAGVVWNPERMKTPWIPPEIAYMLKI